MMIQPIKCRRKALMAPESYRSVSSGKLGSRLFHDCWKFLGRQSNYISEERHFDSDYVLIVFYDRRNKTE